MLLELIGYLVLRDVHGYLKHEALGNDGSMVSIVF